MDFTDDIGPMAFMLAVRAGQSAKSEVVRPLLEGVKSTLFSLGSKAVPAWVQERTSLEQKLMFGAAIYAGWLGHKTGAFSCVASSVGSLTPGYRWVKSLFVKPEVEVDPSVKTRKTTLESRREGSDEAVMTPPRCQARVGFFRDGKFCVIGACVRMQGGCLVGPDHVMGESDVEKYVYGSQHYVSLKGRTREHLATDLVYIKMSEKELSTIGVAEARILPISPSGFFSQIVGPDGKGTTGTLQPDYAAFGRVIYTGTTVGGYSGGAYTDGARILGLHQCGGTINGGYNASYVWMRLKKSLGIHDEDSDEWLLFEFEAGHKIEWQHSGEPGEIEVNVGGRYSYVSRSSMEKAFGKNWETELNSPKLVKRQRRYNDEEVVNESLPMPSASGEAKVLNLPGGSGTSAGTQDSMEQSLQELMRVYRTLSKKKRNAFRSSIISLEKPTTILNGQANAEPSANSTA